MATSIIQVNISEFDSGQQAVAESISATNSSGSINVQQLYPFATGDNTLTKPTGALGLVVWNVTGTLKLYASTNPSIGANTTFPLVLPVPDATILINASASAKATLMWI